MVDEDSHTGITYVSFGICSKDPMNNAITKILQRTQTKTENHDGPRIETNLRHKQCKIMEACMASRDIFFPQETMHVYCGYNTVLFTNTLVICKYQPGKKLQLKCFRLCFSTPETNQCVVNPLGEIWASNK